MESEPVYIEAFVEIPKGSRNKYEYDHGAGVFRLDRILYSSVHYPTDYGFIPGTLAEDGDPLDVMVLLEESTFPGCRIRVRPVGVLIMTDEKGTDAKILAVPDEDPRYDGLRDIADVPRHRLDEIENFFAIYKELEKGKETTIQGWEDVKEACEILGRSRQRGSGEE